MGKKLKILMQFSDYNHLPERRAKNTYGGLGYYRIIKPSQMIKGHDVRTIGTELVYEFGNTLDEQWDNLFKEYDVFWCLHFSDSRAAAAMLSYAQKHKKKVIIDIDDNYLDIPKSNKEYEKFKEGKADRAYLSALLSLAHAVTVSTEPLRDRLKKHMKDVHGIEKPIYLIPNMNDVNDWNHAPAIKDKSKFTIGYSGSNSHHDDLRLVMPAIKKLMEKYEHVWFEMIGVLTPKEAQEFFKDWPQKLRNRVGLVGAVGTFREYPEWLAQQRWNVGIAPLVDTAFTRCKSHIKWLEYSMVKMPTVASRVYPYFMELNGRETITDGENGFLCEPTEWYNKLEKLVLDPKLAERIGEQAYDFVKKNWQYSDAQKYFEDVTNEMLK